jgi:toxin-antitoxin system PIN domain toxin
MIAVDTNILVYATRTESPWHVVASQAIRQLAESTPWAIPWTCLCEFYSVVTHPRRYKPPTPIAVAFDKIESWLESPYLTVLGETSTETGWDTLREVLRTSRVVGPNVHDARIVSLCLQHGVRELWSADRDLSRFPQLRVVNPLIPTKAGEPRTRYRINAPAAASRKTAARPRPR